MSPGVWKRAYSRVRGGRSWWARDKMWSEEWALRTKWVKVIVPGGVAVVGVVVLHDGVVLEALVRATREE